MAVVSSGVSAPSSTSAAKGESKQYSGPHPYCPGGQSSHAWPIAVMRPMGFGVVGLRNHAP